MITLQTEEVEGRKETTIIGLPKKLVNQMEDHIKEWQSNEFDPSGMLEIPTEIESILLDWLPEDLNYPKSVQNVMVEDGMVIMY